MNSLNAISARVSPPQTPVPSRTNSYGNALSLAGATEARRSQREELHTEKVDEEEDIVEDVSLDGEDTAFADEKKPLLENGGIISPYPESSGWYFISGRIASVLLNSLRWVFSTLVAPGAYLVSCFHDETGRFAPMRPIHQIMTLFRPAANRGTSGQAFEVASVDRQQSTEKDRVRKNSGKPLRRSQASDISSSAVSSESESERERSVSESEKQDSPSNIRNTRSRFSDEIAPARRSIRIKLHAEDPARQKLRNGQSTSSQSNGSGGVSPQNISPASLKSPTSPAASMSMTKYPRAPQPPRPLIPRRLPSYSLPEASSGKRAQKTLILDLDETLIHSMAKGGRIGSGHMVEVKLNTYIGGTGLGPQHPILYYVHKRPHCDEFLRRVCKWYNLVIFTASVQEYADPVIDWLEQERKFFTGRFYRQHCTHRNGAFIKDLSSVEPDLSKVMILDNSPLSYMFHQDNAIPIEGWINDPTDNDLLHLVPLLEGLQYVTDVRALLALRGGEDRSI